MSHLRWRLFGWSATLVLLAMFLPPPAVARDTSLKLATDLRADGALAAQKGIPVVVLFSLADCVHCQEVRRSHLAPMSRESSPKAIIRQIDLHSTSPLIDFGGTKTTHAGFAKAAKVTFAPVVVFYDRSGNVVAEPLVGAPLADFYGSYLENALMTATTKLRNTVTPEKSINR